jgi:hypothetical protein
MYILLHTDESSLHGAMLDHIIIYAAAGADRLPSRSSRHELPFKDDIIEF